uniref:Uncharacterized protein n=1 Tax=Euplotes harpa TaxID=151035 RepID=A0A7S3ND43_9SPIT|mmetsp:Transcript_3880/g.4731  ORF Transcript_3880/g.4731 Transcript_3880/m.4731 type:complete len:312 (+) Transcript_3880:41-976(+)
MEKISRLVDSDIKLFDIAANLSDETFRGIYNGKKYHDEDFDVVIQRARDYGVEKFLFAAGYIEDAKISYDLSTKLEDAYITIGVHPCRATEVFKNDGSVEQYQAAIEDTIQTYFTAGSKLLAIGECGLDYDRLNYADKETQLKVFPFHFDLAEKYKLPMYLHSRSTGGDFTRIVKEHREQFSTGVVHSFTGDEDELSELVDLDLYIGINGCSLKTKENCDVVKKIPLERIMLETDCPYCEIRSSHHSAEFVKTVIPKAPKKKYKPEKMTKERNEPCTMIQVLEAVAALHGVSEKELADVAWENTMRMFNLK